MFMENYFNGIAKAMDGHNSIKISKKCIPATISSVWKGVGDEITSSMTTYSNTLSLKSNKLKSLKINYKKREQPHTNNISLDKYKLLVQGIKRLQTKYYNMQKHKNIDNLYKESMLRKSEILSQRIVSLGNKF